MVKRAWILALTVLLLSSACGPPDIQEGKIVTRDFAPAHINEWQHEHTRQDCDMEYSYNTMTGKTEWHEDCDQVHDYWHTHRDHIPDKWTVTIYGCVDWNKKVLKDEEHCDNQTYEVTSDLYHRLEGATWYNVKTGDYRSGDFK